MRERTGVSYVWWTGKHNRHHAHPNTEGADPDIAIGVLAFSPAGAQDGAGHPAADLPLPGLSGAARRPPFSLTMYPASARSLTIPNALRSVIPTDTAISRSRAPGSRAMHSSTRAWLVRKPQDRMRGNYHIIFPEYHC